MPRRKLTSVRELVEQAYREGFADASSSDRYSEAREDREWNDSAAKIDLDDIPYGREVRYPNSTREEVWERIS